MISHRQRRPQQRAAQREQERLHQVLSRLQSALHLGLRPSSESYQKIGGKKWYNTDAEVQVQATRAILAFVNVVSAHPGRPTLPQVSVEESVAALEGLLGAEREAVYSKAADAAAGLVASMGDGLLGYGGERLVGPLAHLLNCSKLSTAISAATALRGILVKVKPRTGYKGTEDGMWSALEDADTLGIIVRSIEEDCGSTGKDATFLELLAVILECRSESRYRLGNVKSFPATLQLKCTSSSVSVVQAALHTLTALALCGCAASILLKDAGNMWSTISFCLQPSQPCNIQLEALRLLTALCRIPTFGTSFSGPHIEGIATGCSRALEQIKCLGEMRWVPEAEILAVEAAHATSSVLSWPGLHHTSFLQNGIEDSLLAALGLQIKRGEMEQQSQPQVLNSTPERRSRGNRLNPRLRPLLWEVVGWLGAHDNAGLDTLSSTATSGHMNLCSKVPELACTALSKALRKRGRNPTWFEIVPKPGADLARADIQGKAQEGQPVNAQEVVQVCKAVLLLLSSPSQAIASSTKSCLEDALVSHGLDWLPSLLTTLALAGSNAIKIDHIQTMTNLLALACVSWLEACQEQLLQLNALQVVLKIVKAHVGDVDQIKTEQLSAMSSTVNAVGAKSCCIDAESWEGYDAVLFSALWALFRLLQGSDWAKEVRGSITEHILENSIWGDIKDGDVLHLLWLLAGDKAKSAGIRWCAVCCLASFGIYGFPSIMAKDMKRAIDDPSLADVVFVLGDGSRLSAHAVMLAARCESLLPANVQSKLHVSSVASDFKLSRRTNPEIIDHRQCLVGETQEIAGATRSEPAEVHVSTRLTYGSLTTLLEFVYTGIVYVPLDQVAEVKTLAKRCHLEPLTSLLQGKSPVWGQPPAPCDLALVLGSKGYPLSDILLRADMSPTAISSEKTCGACNMLEDHLHAHRLVLSSRCDYFEALFRSGMRDSAQEEVNLSTSMDTVVKFLFYLYSEELTEAVPDCAWRYLGMNSQLVFLQSLVELAELAGQWVLEELQRLTWASTAAYLNQNVRLCPAILSLAADKQQWALVDSCAACLAPLYPQLRDSGALDDLHEELKDLVRAANVKLFMMGR